jgi:hypothetical protein
MRCPARGSTGIREQHTTIGGSRCRCGKQFSEGGADVLNKAQCLLIDRIRTPQAQLCPSPRL